MKRALLRSFSIYNHSLHTKKRSNLVNSIPPVAFSSPFRLRFYSSESDSSNGASIPALESSSAEAPTASSSSSAAATESTALTQSLKQSVAFEDISNKELKVSIDKYFEGDEEALPSIVEAILKRGLSKKHEETDDELLEELKLQPLDDVKDREFESDFDELYSTDEEIDDLYSARDIVVQKMAKNEFFNMDDKKWDEMIEESVRHGHLQNTKECEEILEDMLHWDKLLPDDLKRKVEEKFNELGDMCEQGELVPEEAYELFKEFEDEMVIEYGRKMEAENPLKLDETSLPGKKKKSDDPPGEGPVLRWQTRVVFAPGGDAWHPKNRKVKLSVTVKELGLSRHQYRRLRQLVGKRYHPGKDELTITSERFEHREENRKDCLRTLFSLLEEAGKADKFVEEARTSYIKDRLRNNPAFMERLRTKTMKLQQSEPVNA